MNTSVNNISINLSGAQNVDSSTFSNPRMDISVANLKHIQTMLAFDKLPENWDSYGSNKPNRAAIVKAVNFILNQLSPQKQDVFFTAPTTDGDILVELKEGKGQVELIFSIEEDDKIIASYNSEFYAEAILNKTTLNSYINWLRKS